MQKHKKKHKKVCLNTKEPHKNLCIWKSCRIFAIEKETNNNLEKWGQHDKYCNKTMKQTFIIKAHASIVRVAKQYILDSYHPWLWASDDDFSIVQFKTKKEMKEAFTNIARPCGDTFYIDNENGATYIKVDAQGRETAKEFQYLASMITPHSQR